jgi:S-DNA-T family DNA segregation ATPase FtsK/SpoIIIE
MDTGDFDDFINNNKPTEKHFTLKDDRVRVILGFIFIGLSVFLMLSFLSFLFTWEHDQSVFDNSIAQFFLNKDIVVENWGGKFGALVSKKIIHDWMGVSAFLLVLVSLIAGLRLFNITKVSIHKNLRISLILIILLSLSGGYLFRDMWDANIGGAHGYFISQWLIATVGEFGTGVILLVLIMLFILFTFSNSASAIMSLFSGKKEEDTVFVEPQIESQTATKPKHSKESIDDVFFKFAEQAKTKETEAETTNQSEIAPTEQTEVIITKESKTGFKKDKEIEFEIDKFDNVDDTLFEVKEITEKKESIEEEEDDEIQEIIDLDLNDEIPVVKPNENLLEETLIGATPVTITTTKSEEKAENINYDILGDYDPTLELSHYKLPPIELLVDHKSDNTEVSESEVKENLNKIVETLGNYKISIDKIKATIGPTVTLYEIVPTAGVRISKIKNLEDDIALSLAALGIRIIAPIPGKGTIGIEVPNKNPQLVSMRSILESKAFQESKFDLPLALGKTISNETFVVDLCKMPHLLVAGATGMGKSVGLSAIMASLLYKKHPSQIKFVLVDPKKVELTLYSKIENHFLAKLPDTDEAIITDTAKVVNTLNSLCIEMDERYNLLKAAKLRTIKEYNGKFIKRQLNPEEGHRFLPYIVVVIDEFADLIMTAGKEVELPIARLAQLARAIGIHLIIATQRPTTNIITGVIKANFPARIAFRVTSGIDSRTILDETGANQLIGKGDMLVNTGSGAIRVQCAFIDTPEIDKVTDFISEQQGYGSALLLPEFVGENADGGNIDVDLGRRDSMFEDAARLIVSNQQGSTSLIQRKFSIGYNRAGRIMDQLEAFGIVGSQDGSKPRQVLINDLQHLERMLDSMP